MSSAAALQVETCSSCFRGSPQRIPSVFQRFTWFTSNLWNFQGPYPVLLITNQLLFWKGFDSSCCIRRKDVDDVEMFERRIHVSPDTLDEVYYFVQIQKITKKPCQMAGDADDWHPGRSVDTDSANGGICLALCVHRHAQTKLKLRNVSMGQDSEDAKDAVVTYCHSR